MGSGIGSWPGPPCTQRPAGRPGFPGRTSCGRGHDQSWTVGEFTPHQPAPNLSRGFSSLVGRLFIVTSSGWTCVMASNGDLVLARAPSVLRGLLIISGDACRAPPSSAGATPAAEVVGCGRLPAGIRRHTPPAGGARVGVREWQAAARAQKTAHKVIGREAGPCVPRVDLIASDNDDDSRPVPDIRSRADLHAHRRMSSDGRSCGPPQLHPKEPVSLSSRTAPRTPHLVAPDFGTHE